ncbi:ABC-2 type transport system ATP-binding protein [Lentzea fradiae]|uniref:ABC-2 type transport system ATP-binding protein n=1 Tax=Lentzea fradiae TaxID=200378 RepID=A0A1G7X636_9PSEU|nr:ABC-2 type transport system ATP-binding protein [Lentzea fradiae]
MSVSGLSKRFGDRQAVSGLTFEVTRGRAFGLLGPNGSGKTTTVRLLTGLLRPDGGEVALFGERLTEASADGLRARIGVQTDTSLYPSLSARENLRAWGELYGLSRATLDVRIDEVLEVLGLSERAGSLVGQLSKGMRQKLAVGRAVLHTPELLFLDEPTAGLDPEAANDLIAYLTGMVRAANTTVIICTHQLHGLETLCDDIGILKDGTLLTAGDVPTLLHRKWPAQRYSVTVGSDPARAAEVISSVDGLTAEVVAGEVTFSTADEDAVPAAVAALVRHDVPVRAVVPQRPTIEQLYFATLAEEGAA